jgi:amino acid transporter
VADVTVGTKERGSGELVRAIDWKDTFWVVSGVIPLVLFSIGGIAGVTGKLAFLVWAISVVMGFLQAFTYAEIAGLYPNKSGGASVYGATAWLKYSKFIAPLSVWCNWFAWSPVLSLGCVLAAGYILNALWPIPTADAPAVVAWMQANAASITADSPRVAEWLADAANAGKTAQDAIAALLAQDGVAALTPAIRSWELLSFQVPGIGMAHINAYFVIGAILMLIVFAIQDRGILRTASVQKILGIIVIVPMVIIGIWPIITGSINYSNFTNLVPPAASYSAEPGLWNNGGWTLFLGGLYIAAWSTYAFETAVCYTREFKNPATDTVKAIVAAGLFAVAMYILIPFSFQGVLGLEGMLATPIVDGSGIAEALAGLVKGGPVITQILVILMIIALLLAIMTAMAGSSRTLYQASRDGWLPKYLSHVNRHGAPNRAMWTDFGFNLILLALASDVAGYFFVLAVSNVGYIIFNFLNLNAGWIHRIDNGHIKRPWKAPTWLIGLNTVLAFVNALFLGAGAKVWGYENALWAGLFFAALIIPVFAYRHYMQDGGRFPPDALDDIGIRDGELGAKKAGMLPYLTLAAGLIVVLVANWFFVLPS